LLRANYRYDHDQADICAAEEIENLKKEAAAFRAVRRDLEEEDGPRKVFDKVSYFSHGHRFAP
jgi:hypothetical protein